MTYPVTDPEAVRSVMLLYAHSEIIDLCVQSTTAPFTSGMGSPGPHKRASWYAGPDLPWPATSSPHRNADVTSWEAPAAWRNTKRD